MTHMPHKPGDKGIDKPERPDTKPSKPKPPEGEESGDWIVLESGYLRASSVHYIGWSDPEYTGALTHLTVYTNGVGAVVLAKPEQQDLVLNALGLERPAPPEPPADDAKAKADAAD
jgi:hypothetical protein